MRDSCIGRQADATALPMTASDSHQTTGRVPEWRFPKRQLEPITADSLMMPSSAELRIPVECEGASGWRARAPQYKHRSSPPSAAEYRQRGHHFLRVPQ